MNPVLSILNQRVLRPMPIPPQMLESIAALGGRHSPEILENLTRRGDLSPEVLALLAASKNARVLSGLARRADLSHLELRINNATLARAVAAGAGEDLLGRAVASYLSKPTRTLAKALAGVWSLPEAIQVHVAATLEKLDSPANARIIAVAGSRPREWSWVLHSLPAAGPGSLAGLSSEALCVPGLDAAALEKVIDALIVPLTPEKLTGMTKRHAGTLVRHYLEHMRECGPHPEAPIRRARELMNDAAALDKAYTEAASVAARITTRADKAHPGSLLDLIKSGKQKRTPGQVLASMSDDTLLVSIAATATGASLDASVELAGIHTGWAAGEIASALLGKPSLAESATAAVVGGARPGESTARALWQRNYCGEGAWLARIYKDASELCLESAGLAPLLASREGDSGSSGLEGLDLSQVPLRALSDNSTPREAYRNRKLSELAREAAREKPGRWSMSARGFLIEFVVDSLAELNLDQLEVAVTLGGSWSGTLEELITTSKLL